MKRKGLIIAVIAVLFSIVITLTGCDEKTKEKNEVKTMAKTQQEQKKPEEESKIILKNGTYEYVAEEDYEGLTSGDIYVQIADGNIILVDGFAGLSMEGTYKLEGNRILGTYTSMTYINHEQGGEYTTKAINDEIEFVIQKDGTLVDFKGYGAALGNVMMKDALYKLNENPET